MKLISLLAIIAAASLATSCGPKTKETNQPSRSRSLAPTEDFELELEKYELDNGLTVILHRDASDPIVAMATIVHAGSNRERPGRTGFAHFFEHMSFNNSENVPMGANRKMIPELGGSRNGGTWTDGTIYYEVVPRDAFEKLMWIDSDRFGYMINTVKEGTLEREKQVVKNEKRQRVDNRPYGHSSHVIRKALYPSDHPYSWTVIGDLEDLQNATLEDVREFYSRFYTPANATLVVAGDIDIRETRELVQTWFGEIKSGGTLEPDLEPMPVRLDSEKKLYHLDNFAKVAELQLTFPTVEQFHDDSYALEALGSILADGKSTPLYRKIVVDEEQSSWVAAYQTSDEIAGTFTIRIRANPGIDLDDVMKSVESALRRFEKEGVRSTDLLRIKARAETAFYRGLESILDRALAIGIYEEFAGDPSFMFKERALHRAVDEAAILRVYHKYIKDRPAIVTSFVPKEQPTLIVDGSSIAAVIEEKITAGAEKDFEEDTSEDFEISPTKHDRSEPPLGPRPKPRLPDIWQAATDGGIRLFGIEHNELPLVSFSLRIEGGQTLDDPRLLGTSYLTAAMLGEGTRSKTPLELEDAIDLLGASIRISSTATTIDVQGQTLSKNFAATMNLLTEMLLEPRWDAAEFKRIKTARLAEIEQILGDPAALASRAFLRRVYGSDHAAGQPLGGTTETVGRIGLGDLRKWYEASVSARHVVLHVAGAVAAPEVVAATAKLDRSWSHQVIALPKLPVPAKIRKPQVFFIDIPDAKQSVIYAGKPSVTGHDPDFYRLTVAGNRLGAGSSARLTQKLRIEKGYSYGASSRFVRSPHHGVFRASSQVRSNVTLASLEIFRDLIGRYAESFTQADLDITKNLLSKGDTRRFETLGQLRYVLEVMSRFGLPPDYIAKQRVELDEMTLEEARSLIRSEIRVEEMIFMVVGDAKTQLSEVEKLGFGPAILLDRYGERFSDAVPQ